MLLRAACDAEKAACADGCVRAAAHRHCCEYGAMLVNCIRKRIVPLCSVVRATVDGAPHRASEARHGTTQPPSKTPVSSLSPNPHSPNRKQTGHPAKVDLGGVAGRNVRVCV